MKNEEINQALAATAIQTDAALKETIESLPPAMHPRIARLPKWKQEAILSGNASKHVVIVRGNHK